MRKGGERVIRGEVDGRIGVMKEGEGGPGVNGAGLNRAEIQSVNNMRGRWKEEQNKESKKEAGPRVPAAISGLH